MLRSRGFTIIELLVVIAIICLLAALLFPVFSRAKAASLRSTCTSNLEQIGRGLALYAANYDDLLPNEGTRPATDATRDIVECLQPYLHSHEAFRCPAEHLAGPDVHGVWIASHFEGYGSSYTFGINGQALSTPPPPNMLRSLASCMYNVHEAIPFTSSPVDSWRENVLLTDLSVHYLLASSVDHDY